MAIGVSASRPRPSESVAEIIWELMLVADASCAGLPALFDAASAILMARFGSADPPGQTDTPRLA